MYQVIPSNLIILYLYKPFFHFRVVNGGVPETTELLKERFDYIFYTGSTNVGKIIHKAANKYLTPCTLELGGKSPVFIDDNCNLETAAKRILWGKMINTGQTCIAPDYVLCSKKTEDKFVKIANELVKTWYGENSADSPDLCRIITERHFDRLMTLMPSDGKNGKALLGKNYSIYLFLQHQQQQVLFNSFLHSGARKK